MTAATPPSFPGLFRSRRARAIAWQVVVLVAVAGVLAMVVVTTADNLADRNIRSGFGFLAERAGFDISESSIPFTSSDSYGRAFLVGLVNTVRVALIGIVLATALGILVGVGRLARNWLIARLCTVYVETLRNIPLLLQLFFWYALMLIVLPVGRDALNPLPGVYLSSAGLRYPVAHLQPAHLAALASFAVAVVFGWWLWRRARRARLRDGRDRAWRSAGLALALVVPATILAASGEPLSWDVPQWRRFRYGGGGVISPEFLALILGLVLYTATFIAEVVRGGINAVPRGQVEAARALGLREWQVMRLVVLPQALRIIIPPLTNQHLNLLKNSSLAIAIGYPDLVSVANTTLNQTGQAIEAIALVMAVYLALSLAVSTAMNWYNRRVALVGG